MGKSTDEVEFTSIVIKSSQWIYIVRDVCGKFNRLNRIDLLKIKSNKKSKIKLKLDKFDSSLSLTSTKPNQTELTVIYRPEGMFG